ncbi:hypothetical protein DL768_000825 [Monosporascus sp. mg162]|nr:hypothetical protein DL768_000825 [Monosporascus sp. mg162]
MYDAAVSLQPRPSDGIVWDSAMSPLSWWEGQQRLLLFPYNRPSLQDLSTTSDLDALLSMSSYPVPEPFMPQPRSEEQGQLPLYGGLLPEKFPDDQQTDQTIASRFVMQRPPERRRSDLSTIRSSFKKRGRPRKAHNGAMGETTEERRRVQIRLAQRAYRSRKEETTSNLKARVAHLESAIKNMTTTILSFGEQLAQAGVLVSHPDLMSHLRDTIETCVSATKEASPDGEAEADPHPQSEEFLSLPAEQDQESPSPSSYLGLGARQSSDVSHKSTVNSRRLQTWSSTGSPLESNSANSSPGELSVLIKQLHMTCFYRAYLALRNPAITLDSLQSKFRLPLSIMTRERLTSYFESALSAWTSQGGLEEWQDFPFFSLGGAGTHYPQSSPSSGMGRSFHPHQRRRLVRVPLSQLSPEIQEEMDGEWFDIGDLEGFLKERYSRLVTCRPRISNQGSTQQAENNVSDLIQGMIPTPAQAFEFADDLGFSDCGCFGSEIQTPNLDALATQRNANIRYTNYYAAAACSPTRSVLVTGEIFRGARCQLQEITRASPAHSGDPDQEGYLNRGNLRIKAEHRPIRRSFKKSFALLPGCANYAYEPQYEDQATEPGEFFESATRALHFEDEAILGKLPEGVL